MVGIYKIENLITHKKYIGQSIDIKKRWAYHKSMYKYLTHSQIYASMRKHGIENFSFEIIEECPQEQLNEREIYWIEYYDTYKNGYNSTLGGYNTPLKAVNQYTLDGKFIATYISIRQAAGLLNLSETNLSSCCAGKQKSYGGYLWTFIDEPAPLPYVDKRVGHITSSNKRIVQQYNKNNEYIAEYESAHEAARQIGKPKCANHITECCQNKRKTCEGFIWKYKEE